VQRKLETLFSLVALTLLSGCVMATEFEALRNDVNYLKRESFEQRRELNNLKEKTAQTVREDSLQAIRESQAETHSRLSEISGDLQILTGRFDENRYSVEKGFRDSAAETDLLKAQVARMDTQVKEMRDRLNALEGLAKQKETPKETPPQPSKTGEQKDKTKLYESALSAFKDKKYKEAREKFEVFTKEFPEDELTDNAQFWIGETYYNEKDFESAILAYETVLKKYPKSEKAASALLKQGFSFIETGDKKTGKTILENVRERYLNSKEAELAKKKIEEIAKGSGGKKR